MRYYEFVNEKLGLAIGIRFVKPGAQWAQDTYTIRTLGESRRSVMETCDKTALIETVQALALVRDAENG